MGQPKGWEYRSKTMLGRGLPRIVPNGMAKGLGIQIQDNVGAGLTRDSPKWDGQSAGNVDPRQRWGGSYQGQSKTGWPKYREYRSKKVLGWGLPIPQSRMGWPKYREYRPKKVLGWVLPGTVPDGMAKVQGI